MSLPKAACAYGIVPRDWMTPGSGAFGSQLICAPVRGNSTVGGRMPTLTNTGALPPTMGAAQAAFVKTSLCQPRLGVGTPVVSFTTSLMTPLPSAFTVGVSVPPPPRSQTLTRPGVAVPVTTNVSSAGLGLAVGSRGDVMMGAGGEAGTAGSTVRSHFTAVLSAQKIAGGAVQVAPG